MGWIPKGQAVWDTLFGAESSRGSEVRGGHWCLCWEEAGLRSWLHSLWLEEEVQLWEAAARMESFFRMPADTRF